MSLQDDMARHFHLQGFVVSDTETSGDVMYWGYLNSHGSWYILKQDTALGTYRYCKGSSAYPTAWTNRATQIYNYYNIIFNV